jgi:hypothetical protein
MGSGRLGKDTTAAIWWPLRGRRQLFLITAAMVPAIGELDLGDDLGMIEDRAILAWIEGGRMSPSSSFMARAPVLSEKIRAVEIVNADDFELPDVGISLRSITTFGP